MQSKLLMDLDGTKPVIQIQVKESGDLRDKVFKLFKEEFGHQSSWCRAQFYSSTGGFTDSLAIYPVSPDQIISEIREMIECLNGANVEASDTNNIMLIEGIGGLTPGMDKPAILRAANYAIRAVLSEDGYDEEAVWDELKNINQTLQHKCSF